MRRRVAAAAVLGLCASVAANPSRKARANKVHDALGRLYGRRSDIVQAAQSIAQEHALETAWVEGVLAQARFVAQVAQLVMPSATPAAKNWVAYRTRFVEARRIEAGVQWWRDNENWLTRAEERFGVPSAIVVGIVGVETIYGRQMGNYRAIDALATLSFDFPTGRRDRSAFFRDELESLFVLSRRERLSPLELKGSYAGAIGMPQFMPSTMTRDAIDFDQNGHVDLHKSSADVIGSVANFLSKAGWLRGLPTYFDVDPPIDTAARIELVAPDIVPLFSPQEFVDRGARLGPSALAIDGKLALIELQNGDALPSYVAGTTNFYAITRYNWSSYYAMAVIALGEAVKQRLSSEPARASAR